MDIESALKTLGYQGKVVIDKSDIKKRYRKLSKKLHPDSPNGSEEKFKQLFESQQFVLKYCKEKTVIHLDKKKIRVAQGDAPLTYIINNRKFTL